MRLINKIKGWFRRKDSGSYDRLNYLVAYKSEADYFDKINLYRKLDASLIHEPSKETIISEEWGMINWSRVTPETKDRILELAKQDIQKQVNEL